jgi:hypothetical protein
MSPSARGHVVYENEEAGAASGSNIPLVILEVSSTVEM